MATKAPVTKMPAAKPAKTGTAVAVKKVSANNIVDIRALLAKETESLGERVGAPGGDSIRVTQDKNFEMPDGTTLTELKGVVIVDFVSTNKFYEGAYDPKNISPPACFAIGTNPSQMVASDNSPVKQADTCAVCPMNQFGSSGNGKACKNSRVLALLPADADEDTPLMILGVSPTALKAFDAFVTSIVRSFQLPPVGVMVDITFDPNSSYASLRFGNPQPNTNLANHFARKDEAQKRLATEPDVSQYEAPAPARKAAAPARRK
jgi:hypothetical protein